MSAIRIASRSFARAAQHSSVAAPMQITTTSAFARSNVRRMSSSLIKCSFSLLHNRRVPGVKPDDGRHTTHLQIALHYSPICRYATTSSAENIIITPHALKRVEALEKKAEGQLLRIAVDAGGCGGFKYEIELDSDIAEDDVVIEGAPEAKIVVDTESLEYLKGSTLDFVEELISASFRIVHNPNADNSCGCGTSFTPAGSK